MKTEEDVYLIIAKVMKDNEKIPLTQRGLYFLIKEVHKLLPEGGFIISCQSLQEMSVQDRAERKSPKIYVERQK